MIIVDIIYYRVRFLIYQETKSVKWIFSLLFSILIISISIGIAFLLNNGIPNNGQHFDSRDLWVYLYRILFIFTISRTIIPSYKPLRPFFNNYHPVSYFKSFIISLLLDFFRPYFLFVLIFILVLTIGLNNDNIIFFTTSSLVVLISHLLRRFMQLIFDYRHKIREIIVWGFLFLCNIYFFILIYENLENLIASLVILGFLLFFGCFFIEKNSLERKNLRSISFFRHNFIKIILGNSRNRMILIIAFLIKLGIISSDIGSYSNTGEHLFNSNLLFFIVFTPLPLFSLVYNNIWSFWNSVWFRSQISGGIFTVLFFHLRLMVVPIIVDLIITFLYIYIQFNMGNVYYFVYIFCLFALIPLSIIWSVSKPKKVYHIFQIDTVTSLLGNLISISVVLFIVFIVKRNLIFPFIPILYLIIFFGVGLVLSAYKGLKYKLFENVK